MKLILIIISKSYTNDNINKIKVSSQDLLRLNTISIKLTLSTRDFSDRLSLHSPLLLSTLPISGDEFKKSDTNLYEFYSYKSILNALIGLLLPTHKIHSVQSSQIRFLLKNFLYGVLLRYFKYNTKSFYLHSCCSFSQEVKCRY